MKKSMMIQHGVQYESGVDVEPLINVDTNHDLIPDINIDTDGDMKADINISKDGLYPYLNIAIVHAPWLPETKYVYQGFVYDTQIDFERYLNIDTNKDGLPDVNIDLNGDGIADLNVDTTGNEIPNVDIDTDGDGLPDVNLDTNGDGHPDKEIMEIKEWNPTHMVEGEIDYGTSFIERLDYLENQGIQVEKPNDRFLPNYALRVQDVTSERKEEIASILSEEGREIVSIYEVDLLRDGVKVQPDGRLLVKIPVVEGLVNPAILLQMEDGNYQAVYVEIIDGFYYIETEYLGIISILKEGISSNQQVPVVVPNKNTGGAVEEEIKTKVAGSFTGDDLHSMSYFIGFTISSLSLLLLCMRKKA